jgi:hypothetical protein
MAFEFCADQSISLIRIETSGVLRVSAPVGEEMAVCNVNTAMGTWNAASCKSLHSQLLSAFLAGKKVNINFITNGTCAVRTYGSDMSSTLNFVEIK